MEVPLADTISSAANSPKEMFDGLYKADLHLLTLVLERSRRFRYGNILTGVNKLDAVRFRV